MSSPIRRFHREALGAVFEVRVDGAEDPGYLRTVLETAWDELAHVEAEVSPGHPGNALDAALRMAEGERMRIPPHLRDCLRLARRLRAETAAAYDAEGAASPAAGVPEATEAWSVEGDDLACHRAGWGVDLSGLSQGYALDRMGDVLREWGVDRALLSAGGSLVLALEPPGDREGWRVGVDAWELRLRHVALASFGGAHPPVARDPRGGVDTPLARPARALSGSAAEAACLARAAAFGSAAEAEEWVRLGCGRGLWLADGTRLGVAADLDLRPLAPSGPTP
jgi:FAD:protein FMN transferase